MPSAEDLKNEKVHENLQKGIEGFTPDKLKAVKTKEPASGADRKKTFSCIVINVYYGLWRYRFNYPFHLTI